MNDSAPIQPSAPFRPRLPSGAFTPDAMTAGYAPGHVRRTPSGWRVTPDASLGMAAACRLLQLRLRRAGTPRATCPRVTSEGRRLSVASGGCPRLHRTCLGNGARPLSRALWRRPRTARTLPDRAFRRCKHAGHVRPGSHRSSSQLLAGNGGAQPSLAAAAGWSMAASHAGRKTSREGPCPHRLLPQNGGVGRCPSSGLKISRAPLIVASPSSAGLDDSRVLMSLPRPPHSRRPAKGGASALAGVPSSAGNPSREGSLLLALDRQPHDAAGPANAGPTLQPRVPAPFCPRRNA